MINNVTLVGRLTKDPELRYTANGTGVATFTLAINRNFTNQAGEREADFVQCVIWRKPAETLANYARKGTLLGVTGRIQTRSYDNQQGQRVYVTEVVAESFQLLESKATSEQRQSTQASQPTQQ
ncbi:single-stranded DNA-binding protein, partial [Enterococcus casseliflavus]|uniref:single-stranded DNA-binding protein n=1 Tax=Enterococcus casseliflavus TaxID=37734 RepID=UPI0039A5D5D5